MKKILIVSSAFPRWEKEGLDVFMYEYAKTLAQDFDVFVLAPLSKGSKRYEEWDNFKIYRHNQFPLINFELAYGNGIMENLRRNPLLWLVIPFYFILQVLAIRKIVKRHRIEIIHANWIVPQGLTSVLYKKIFHSKIKILGTIHGSDFNALNGLVGKPLKTFVMNNLNILTVVSESLQEAVKQTDYSREVELFPMGVDTAFFSPEKKDPELKQRLGIKGPFLLFIGTINEGKGIRYLISAVATLTDEFPDLKLVVIGKGDLLDEMVELTQSLHITDSVLFLGSVPNQELPAFYATADLFILPSFSEGFPIVIKEALSSGVYIVVTDLPVFSSNPILKEALFKVKTANVEDIAEQVTYILKHKEQLTQLKVSGREYIVESTDWNQVRKKHLELFNRL